MATFSDLQADVQVRIIDLPPRVTAAVPYLINQAIKRLCRRHNFKAMEQELSLTTAVGVNTLTTSVASTFKELRGKPYRVDYTQGQATPLGMVAKADALRVYGNASSPGQPEVVVDGGIAALTGLRTFLTYPYPDGHSDYPDGEYRIQLPIWAYPVDLSAGSDTNWFVANAYDYIIKDATGQGMFLNWDNQGGQVWATLAKGEGDDVILRDKHERLAGTSTLKISTWAR